MCCSSSSSPICWAELGNLSEHAFLYKRDKTTHRPQRVEGELNMKSLISSGLHTQLKALGKHSPLLPRPGMTAEASPDQATPRWACSPGFQCDCPFKAAVNEESGTRTQQYLSLGTRCGWSSCTFTAYTWNLELKSWHTLLGDTREKKGCPLYLPFLSPWRKLESRMLCSPSTRMWTAPPGGLQAIRRQRGRREPEERSLSPHHLTGESGLLLQELSLHQL